MPPLPVLPNQPTGAPDWYSPSGASGSTMSTSGSRPRFYSTQNGPVTLPSDWSDEDAQAWAASYDKYIGNLTQAWQQSSGLQRRQIEAQITDAKKARDNQMAIARLQDKTSRYGTDAQTANELAQRQENARQFDATHALDMQKLGLTRAQTATDYLSQPDRFVQASDFLNLSGRVLAGQGGPSTGSGAVPQMKTMADFDALTAGGNPGRQVDPSQAAAGYASGGAAPTAATGTGADARVKALRGLIDAAPPSDEPGLDNNAYHVLNAAKAIYSMNLTPQQQATLGSDKQSFQMLGSAGRRLGENPDAWWQKQQNSLPGQQSVRAA